ncbi:MAG: phosphoenolpyruvate synthase [Proteobacteria bacterium]|nr:MAG: phosphoenolpyruvate synthase [Pseudomonadota bacterium]
MSAARRALRSVTATTLTLAFCATAAAQTGDPSVYGAWIEEMKASPQGPFGGIGWFCVDGSVLGPRAGCSARGGGIQHGTWSDRTRQLRADGYLIANILADLDGAQFTGPEADLELLRQVVIERFLMGWDQGWISRGAYTYRGAYQIEDEEAGARRVVIALLGDPAWRDPSRFAFLRETVRLLPVHVDTVNAAQVRADALALAAADPGFMSLRAKIHNAPDAADADRVRDYARERGRSDGRYEELAHSIERLYAPDGALAAVLKLAPIIAEPAVEKQLRAKSDEFKDDVKPGRKLAAAARLLRLLRETFPRVHDPDVALEVLMTSLALEREVWAAGNVALSKIDGLTRRTRLWLLGYSADALYGIGMLSLRQLDSVEKTIIAIEGKNPSLREYRDTVRYLSRIPEWGSRGLEFHFGQTVERWAVLDAAVRQYVPDRLRGSPMLTYSAVLDRVVEDVNALAGVQHEVFGENVGGGVRALNPGLARGKVRELRPGQSPLDLDPDGIYVLPETTPDLAPVAGILTLGEGSSLSHLQLLARNLGIPNVVIGGGVLPRVEKKIGSRAVLAVSPGGVVQIAADGSRWNEVFGGERSAPADSRIDVDPGKLDLDHTEFLPFAQLRSWDSGRIVGPKGANLAELRFAFGDAVPNGFVIPFGAFRRVLDQPLEPGGPTVWSWMKERYAAIGRASGAEKKQLVSEFLARLRAWIENVDPGTGFEAQLRWNLEQAFGKDDGYGVFVRSDTNVEDLPGFTGAGLNRTIPNVVGYDAILRAIREVWASPFTERAYSWRQAHMTKPEYVFPAVVVQRAFPSDKSGVLVTVDVERGDPGYLTVAVNEGVAGAVDGQPAESLRIDAESGAATVLAQAAASERTVLAPAGGIVRRAASGTDRILEPAEIQQLVRFARQVPTRFPSLRTASGAPVPADIEFAFRDGRLALLQIRPFNESRRAQKSQYLAQLDAPFAASGARTVNLGALPGNEPPEPVAQAEPPASAKR